MRRFLVNWGQQVIALKNPNLPTSLATPNAAPRLNQHKDTRDPSRTAVDGQGSTLPSSKRRTLQRSAQSRDALLPKICDISLLCQAQSPAPDSSEAVALCPSHRCCLLQSLIHFGAMQILWNKNWRLEIKNHPQKEKKIWNPTNPKK